MEENLSIEDYCSVIDGNKSLIASTVCDNKLENDPEIAKEMQIEDLKVTFSRLFDVEDVGK